MKKNAFVFSILATILMFACKMFTPTAQATATPEQTATACVAHDGYKQLQPNEEIVLIFDDQELATITWENGMIRFRGETQGEVSLPNGKHTVEFILTLDGVPTAWGRMEVVVCNGDFYFKEPRMGDYHA